MDEEGRFTLGSDEFVRLIGPQTAAVLGQSWQEIARRSASTPRAGWRAIATRDTWSGLTVGWPVDDSAERLRSSFPACRCSTARGRSAAIGASECAATSSGSPNWRIGAMPPQTHRRRLQHR